jgi:hypothetical protein
MQSTKIRIELNSKQTYLLYFSFSVLSKMIGIKSKVSQTGKIILANKSVRVN